MTNNELIVEVMTAAADLLPSLCQKVCEWVHCLSDSLPQMLLSAARNEVVNPDGDGLYSLWCDGCGDCDACCEEGSDDKAQLDCIRRFLNKERSEPRG